MINFSPGYCETSLHQNQNNNPVPSQQLFEFEFELYLVLPDDYVLYVIKPNFSTEFLQGTEWERSILNIGKCYLTCCNKFWLQFAFCDI